MPQLPFTAPFELLVVLCLAIAVSEFLARATPLRHVGTSLLVILATALLANFGAIPTSAEPHPLYDALFDEVIALAIFWLLLHVRLAAIWQAGIPMLVLFAVGAAGLVVGVPLGMFVVGGPERFGEAGAGLGAMFVGTYTGGSLNFNALADVFGVDRRPAMYAGAAVVDSLLTTVWMVLGVILPRVLGRGADAGAGTSREEALGLAEDTETVHPLDLALLIFLGGLAVVGSRMASAALAESGWTLHPHLILTLIALVLAQVPICARLKGTRTLGMFAVYLFLAAIGALCDVNALMEVSEIGPPLLIVASVALATHGLFTFGVARALNLDARMAAVASQANVGGGSTALALARSLGRTELGAPALLLGSLGTASGTFLGYLVGVHFLGGTPVQ
jgi:uncharacterized membrane protein